MESNNQQQNTQQKQISAEDSIFQRLENLKNQTDPNYSQDSQKNQSSGQQTSNFENVENSINNLSIETLEIKMEQASLKSNDRNEELQSMNSENFNKQSISEMKNSKEKETSNYDIVIYSQVNFQATFKKFKRNRDMGQLSKINR